MYRILLAEKGLNKSSCMVLIRYNKWNLYPFDYMWNSRSSFEYTTRQNRKLIYLMWKWNFFWFSFIICNIQLRYKILRIIKWRTSVWETSFNSVFTSWKLFFLKSGKRQPIWKIPWSFKPTFIESPNRSFKSRFVE